MSKRFRCRLCLALILAILPGCETSLRSRAQVWPTVAAVPVSDVYRRVVQSVDPVGRKYGLVREDFQDMVMWKQRSRRRGDPRVTLFVSVEDGQVIAETIELNMHETSPLARSIRADVSAQLSQLPDVRYRVDDDWARPPRQRAGTTRKGDGSE